MQRVNLADAKAHLSELVTQAESGEAVCITRRGRPVAQLSAIAVPHRPVALSVLRALPDSMPKQMETAGDFIRQIRDESRY